MLGPVSNEDEGPDSGIGCARALSLVFRVRAGAGTVAGVMFHTWWCSDVVSAARESGLSAGGGPLLLQDVWVCLPEVVEGAEEASLDAGHVLFREDGRALAGCVWTRPQQGDEAGCHHVRAEVQGGGARGGGSHAVHGGLSLLGTQCDVPHPPLCGDPPGPLGPFGEAIHRLAKVLVAAADGEQRVQGPVLPRAPDVGSFGLSSLVYVSGPRL